jgi:hypothetical protein
VLRRVLREQRRILVPLAAVLAINIGVYAAVVYPLGIRVADASSRAATAEAARRNAQREFDAAQGVATGKSRAEAELRAFYSEVLPASVSAADRATYLPIAQAARKDNLQVSQWRSHRAESHQDTTLERLEITLAVEGTYEDIRRFIYDLEMAPAFVVIDSLAIEQGREAGRPLVLRLGLSTYFRTSDHAS